jgi:hypothetical protein
MKITVPGLSIATMSRSIKAGGMGFYAVKVTALEDLPSSRFALYLPSGLSGELWDSPSGFYSFVKDNDATVAYGDSTRGDAYVAELSPLKKGQSQMVVLPFIAKRLGVFNGEIVQFSIPSQADSTQVTKGMPVEVN